MRTSITRGFVTLVLVAAVSLPPSAEKADARALSSQIEVLDRVPRVRPEFPVPNEPDQLFYIERSVNDNTVVYAAHFDRHGRVDPNSPVDVYWRWYNVDGHKKPLNFIERMTAYGVRRLNAGPSGQGIAVKLVALPERRLIIDKDDKGHPEALLQMGTRTARLVYVYLQVDDRGFMPNVTAMDVFGIDKGTGKILHEHIVQD
jgi:hypothetical protein